MTVDGAAFNNAFGIGGNPLSNGSPISPDALDQVSVSSSPYDVRLSGFTGGAISAVTKSGTNQFKGTAYMYTTNSHLRGDKVSDYQLNRLQSHSTTWGVSLGGPIIKDKLFFFANGEYQANISAGPSRYCPNECYRRLEAKLRYRTPSFAERHGEYAPVPPEQVWLQPRVATRGYSLDTPSYKFLARLDWNINKFNKVNLRFSEAMTRIPTVLPSSTTPFKDTEIYPWWNI